MRFFLSRGWALILGTMLIAIMAIFVYGNYNLDGKPNPPANKGEGQARDPSTNVEVVWGLPWEKDPEFLEAIKIHDTPLLLAQFQAILRDPLLGELFNVDLAARKLAGTVLKPGETFSQNGRLGPYTKEKGYRSGPMYMGTRVTESVGGGVCKIASLLYNVATLANLQIIERHNHSMPVPYVPPGQDATVAYGGKDFKFKNNTNESILIWAGTVDHTVFMAMYGKTTPPAVTWHHETLQRSSFPTLYRNDPNLPKGTQKILVPGMDGCLVETTLVVEYSDGEVEIRELGRSWYNPMPEVIARGTAQ